MVAHATNLRIWEAEVGDKTGEISKNLSLKRKKSITRIFDNSGEKEMSTD